MSDLLIGLLSTLLASNTPAATSNLIQQQTGLSVNIPDPNDPVEREFQKLMEDDDRAQEEVDDWIVANKAFAEQGAAVPNAELNARIMRRFATVQTNYEAFLAAHTNHARACLAYASFLMDVGNEKKGVEYMERARKLDPSNPAAWNNLANYYGHRSPVKKAFEYYAKAIELDPAEPVYYHNFGTTVYLFRKDAREYYGITEQQVFDKAMALYAQALKLDPTNFPLATDIAQSYYGIKPLRTNDAIQAWDYAMSIARDQIERDGIHIHLARINKMAGNYDEARRQLSIVTNAIYLDLKKRVARSIDDAQYGVQEDEDETNSPPAKAVKPDE